LGVGAGTASHDASVLGTPAWSPAERTARFAEFVDLLDTLLTNPATTFAGQYYCASDARMLPGCVQQPRLPFAIAATGPAPVTVVFDIDATEPGPSTVIPFFW